MYKHKNTRIYMLTIKKDISALPYACMYVKKQRNELLDIDFPLDRGGIIIQNDKRRIKIHQIFS